MNELKLFRPHAAPGVEKCGHYVPSITTSPNALRGGRFHETMAKLWRKEYSLDDVPRDLWEPVDWTYGELEPLFTTAETKGVEEKFQLYDEFEQFITDGTVDLWGQWSKPQPITVLADYKTGQERDYSAQLWVYALMLLDKLGVEEAELIILFVDQKRTFRERVTRAQLEDRVWRIVAKVSDPRAPHVINRFCDYCDLRFRCPAWEEEKQLAARMALKLPESEFDDEVARELVLAPSFETILANPDLLGRFIIAYKRFRKLVEKIWEIESRALQQMDSGIDLPGCIKVDNPGAESVDAPKFLEAVREHADPNELLAMVKTVDNDKARELYTTLQMTKPKVFKTAIPLKYSAPSRYIKVKE